MGRDDQADEELRWGEQPRGPRLVRRSGRYIPKARIREAAGDALKASHIGRLLHERGLLAQRPEPDRHTVRWVPNIGAVDCYALRRSAFGRSEHEVAPDIYVVHHGARHA